MIAIVIIVIIATNIWSFLCGSSHKPRLRQAHKLVQGTKIIIVEVGIEIYAFKPHTVCPL